MNDHHMSSFCNYSDVAAQQDLESAIYYKAFKKILSGLSASHIADLLKETQKDTLGFTTDEKTAIVAEAAERLRKA